MVVGSDLFLGLAWTERVYFLFGLRILFWDLVVIFGFDTGRTGCEGCVSGWEDDDVFAGGGEIGLVIDIWFTFWVCWAGWTFRVIGIWFCDNGFCGNGFCGNGHVELGSGSIGPGI